MTGGRQRVRRGIGLGPVRRVREDPRDLFGAFGVPGKIEGGDDGQVLQQLRIRDLLQALLQECAPTGACDEALLYMGGMTELHGYAVDSENQDIILLGSGNLNDGGRPLYLVDFVASLRNSFGRYTVLNDDMIEFEGGNWDKLVTLPISTLEQA